MGERLSRSVLSRFIVESMFPVLALGGADPHDGRSTQLCRQTIRGGLVLCKIAYHLQSVTCKFCDTVSRFMRAAKALGADVWGVDLRLVAPNQPDLGDGKNYG